MSDESVPNSNKFSKSEKQSCTKVMIDPKQPKFFPVIVHDMISKGDDSVISWVQDGEAFMVKDMVGVLYFHSNIHVSICMRILLWYVNWVYNLLIL